MKTRLITIGAVIMAVSMMPAQAHAKKSFLEILLPGIFGQKDNASRPEETLIAPFAYEPPQGAVAGEGAAESILPLNVPHRSIEEIGNWVMDTASEVMTFESESYKDDAQKAALYFDEAGYKEYLAFLQESSILKVLDSQQYFMRSFVREQPLLVNEGVLDGRFRWVFEFTVMASYMGRDMKGYKKQVSAPVNQEMKITIQVGRTKNANNEHEVLIESWKGKVQKVDKE